MPKPTVLPFDAFLDVLHAKGYGVGLHEYAALANLLQHWDRTHPSEFGDAIAALIGRSDEEVRGIRRLFDEIYGPAPQPVPIELAETSRLRLIWLRQHAWSVALVSALLLVGIGVALYPKPAPPPKVESPIVPEVPTRTPTPEPAVTLPPPDPPSLPPAPRRLERRFAMEALGGGFLAALAWFWALKARGQRRLWLREAWSSVRASLPGPYHFQDVLPGPPAHLARADMEDAATILGRVFSADQQAREIDVRRSLRATLRRGLMTSLVFKSRRTAESILVFQDVCQEMRHWDAKVNTFLTDLRRQGVSLERWHYDGDLRRLSERPYRPATDIDTVLRGRPSSPVMIISSGTGLAAMLDADGPDGNSPWLHALRQRARRTWLTPVADVTLWPREFEALPLDVWPMTHLGLTNAARQLAGVGGEADATLKARLVSEGRVTVDDIERMKRLASLVPHPSPGLLDILRRRFAPDISDAAVPHLLAQAEGPAAPVVRLSDAELRRLLNDVRKENPDLETAARETILEVLANSEPVPGSAAHERWQIAVGVQKFLLADMKGTERESTDAAAALQALGAGPMWEEVQEALRIAPSTPGVARQVTRLARRDRLGPIPPSNDERLIMARRVAWSWPGFREAVPAAAAALLLLVAALGLGVMPARAVEHVQEAYELEYLPTPSTAAPQLRVRLPANGRAVPRRVSLYGGTEAFKDDISLGSGAPATIQLAAADTGKYYQVRATLPDGNLAVSRPVWVPSDQLVFVLIDASPWAEVTIRGGGTTLTKSQQTPFTAALLPGTYQLQFDNPQLGAASTLLQSVTVPVAGNAVHVTMKGFDAARAVDNLMQQQQRAQAR
jgi:hypothetical protein